MLGGVAKGCWKTGTGVPQADPSNATASRLLSIAIQNVSEVHETSEKSLVDTVSGECQLGRTPGVVDAEAMAAAE
jgi:hypothetical protein